MELELKGIVLGLREGTLKLFLFNPYNVVVIVLDF